MEVEELMGSTTAGLVCGHHHLYSALARGMPAPPSPPTNFVEILEQIWWRLDVALDEEMIRWSAMLGAVEALSCGTTGIIDHHESPSAIDGSLSIIADACAEVGVRVSCAYGVTDRHGSAEARRGLAENERFLRAGGRGMVGVHAAFTCRDETLRVYSFTNATPPGGLPVSTFSLTATGHYSLVNGVLQVRLNGEVASTPFPPVPRTDRAYKELPKPVQLEWAGTLYLTLTNEAGAAGSIGLLKVSKFKFE